MRWTPFPLQDVLGAAGLSRTVENGSHRRTFSRHGVRRKTCKSEPQGWSLIKVDHERTGVGDWDTIVFLLAYSDASP